VSEVYRRRVRDGPSWDIQQITLIVFGVVLRGLSDEAAV
jgi:hypothetical protein